jgi:hypothetical protein
MTQCDKLVVADELRKRKISGPAKCLDGLITRMLQRLGYPCQFGSARSPAEPADARVYWMDLATPDEAEQLIPGFLERSARSEDFALVVDSTPEVHPLAGDPHHHLVQVPSVARARTASP